MGEFGGGELRFGVVIGSFCLGLYLSHEIKEVLHLLDMVRVLSTAQRLG